MTYKKLTSTYNEVQVYMYIMYGLKNEQQGLKTWGQFFGTASKSLIQINSFLQ